MGKRRTQAPAPPMMGPQQPSPDWTMGAARERLQGMPGHFRSAISAPQPGQWWRMASGMGAGAPDQPPAAPQPSAPPQMMQQGRQYAMNMVNALRNMRRPNAP